MRKLRSSISGPLKRLFFKLIEEYNNAVFSNSNNPYDIKFQQGASLKRPFRVAGGDRISVGKNSIIGREAWLEAILNYGDQAYSPEIQIGSNVHIGNNACITAINKVSIGSNTLISEYFYTSDHTHGHDPAIRLPPIEQPLISKGEVSIGDNCFIGFRVSVLPGVRIGNYCVVGAHSVVTRSFEDYSVIGGVPATLIKKYCVKENRWINA